jgi:hypothetical protein
MKPEVKQLLNRWADEFAARALRDPPPSLRVLVWGPSLTGQPADEDRRRLQEKRQKIIDDLQDLGHAATTSEELLERAMEKTEFEDLGNRPLQHVEAHQLQEADFVIVLLGPPGTIAETSGLLTSRTLARRAAVFYDATAVVGGYLEAGPLSNLEALGVTHPYDHDDLVSCRVADAAVEFVNDQAESLRGTRP